MERNGPGAPVPWVNSRYNFAIPLPDRVLLYNSNTGATLQLHGMDAAQLAQLLTVGLCEWTVEELPDDLFHSLRTNGFLVEVGTNELELIRQRFQRARGWTPLVVTITTTMDCNLGCYYCYESRTRHRLEASSIPALVDAVKAKLAGRTDKSLHVDWYGGEPTLNLEFLETASRALQEMCASEAAIYSASIISNGTTWPTQVGDFLVRNRIRQVQISFDGLRDSHNKRRRYRTGRAPSSEASSFDVIASLVDILLDHVRVDIRLNLDRKNQHELNDFVDFARSRGWFSRKFRPALQPARLAAYSDRSEFMRGYQLSATEFDALRTRLRESATDLHIEESEVPDGYPYPRTSVCAALARDSFVLGADGLQYRCGLLVGETHRAVGRLGDAETAIAFADSQWWDGFDPTSQPNCSRCSFLPICWGGCPKKHLENDTAALEEQSIYWRRNLPRLVASRFSLEVPAGFMFSESDQFR